MMIPAKYILCAFAVAFASLAVLDLRSSGKLSPGRKTQLFVAAVFLIISVLLHFYTR